MFLVLQAVGRGRTRVSNQRARPRNRSPSQRCGRVPVAAAPAPDRFLPPARTIAQAVHSQLGKAHTYTLGHILQHPVRIHLLWKQYMPRSLQALRRLGGETCLQRRKSPRAVSFATIETQRPPQSFAAVEAPPSPRDGRSRNGGMKLPRSKLLRRSHSALARRRVSETGAVR